MRVQAQVLVCGVGERKSAKDGRVFHSVTLYGEGQDAGALECSVPNEGTVLSDLKASAGKKAEVVLNIRTFKGTTYVDCVGVKK